MPTVPRVTRQVGPSALPSARKTAAETDTSTGAGYQQARARKFAALGQLGGSVEELGHALGDIEIAERKRADEVQANANDNQLSAWVNQRLYDPNGGALTLKGRDSFDLPETVLGEFDQVAGDIEKTLATDTQREAFKQQELRHRANLDLTLRRHVYEQMQAYDANQTQAVIENNVNAAIANATDPRRIGESIEQAVRAATMFARRNGIGPDQLQQQVDAITTKAHSGVIDSLLAQDNTRAATIYYEETKSQISGDGQARIERALEVGTIKKEAQTKADEIIAAGGTLSQQRDKAKQIDDPDVRDAVMARIEHEDAVNDKAARDAEENLLKGAYDTVRQTGSLDSLPPATLLALGDHLPGLQSYANTVARGVPVQTNDETYYALLQQAADDPGTFATQPLLSYRAKLDDADFKQLAGLQLSIRNGARSEAEKGLEGFRTKNQILEDSLAQYGIDPKAKPNSKEGRAMATLRRQLDLRLQTQEALTGKKAEPTDMQAILDDLLSQKVETPGSFWYLLPGGRSPFGNETRLIDTTIDDIPPLERQQVEQALRAAGRPVTDATVLDLWIDHKSRTR